MPPSPARALLLLLLVPALAGCADVASDEAAPAEATPDATLVTRPDDASALQNASAPGWHLHDYWDGRSRLVAVDQENQVGGWRCGGCDEIAMRFRGDPGMIVPLGASHLEVAATWEGSGDTRHGQPELWVKTADKRERERVAPLESGVPVTVEVTNDQADPPHQVLSRWEFWVVFPAVDEEAYFSGTVEVFGEVVRGREIPPFPPHPDLWGGATEIPLFDETVASIVQHENVEEGSRSCYGDCAETHVPIDGVIVPYDAAAVLVTLTYEPGLPAGLGLRAHGGDTWEREPAPGETTPPTSVTFRVPVTPERGDSPYAKQSLWEFEVFLDQPAASRAFVGGYSVSAVAVRE